MRVLLLPVLIVSGLLAQDRKVDPTWLRRSIPVVSQPGGDEVPSPCQYVPVFGEGDSEGRILRTVTRFGEIILSASGKCPAEFHDRQEEIYYVLQGNVLLRYADQTYSLRTSDFTYLPPGIKHSMANGSQQAARVLVMTFRIAPRTLLRPPSPHPTVVSLNDVK